jgi:hypothetical protein
VPNIPLARKIVLDEHNGTARYVGHVESYLIPLGDTDNLDSR